MKQEQKLINWSRNPNFHNRYNFHFVELTTSWAHYIM